LLQCTGTLTGASWRPAPFDTGARVEECARLEVEDFAITARTGEIRLHGKGDEVRS
jgi:hypothetical protein